MGFRLVTLNLNGIRSAHNKGFVSWAETMEADCMGVQEVKAQHEHVHETFDTLDGMAGRFHYAVKKGYSGVGLYSRVAPTEVVTGASFRVVPDPSVEGAHVVRFSPGGTVAPRNAVIEIEYSEPLAPSTVNTTNVLLYDSMSQLVAGTAASLNGDRVAACAMGAVSFGSLSRLICTPASVTGFTRTRKESVRVSGAMPDQLLKSSTRRQSICGAFRR